MLLTIMGPSASGKTSFVRQCEEQLGFEFITPTTSRARRPGEVDGRDYHFVSVAEFENRLLGGDYTVWDYVGGNYYGHEYGDMAMNSSHPSRQVAVISVRMFLDLRRMGVHPIGVFLDEDEIERRKRIDARSWMTSRELALRSTWDAEQKMLSHFCDFYQPGCNPSDGDNALEYIRSRLENI